MNFLLVAEGPTDEPIIKSAIQGFLNSNINIKIIEPQFDATLQKYEAFGYEGVLNWCKKINGEHGRTLKGLIHFSKPKPSALLIHLDADIAHEITIQNEVYNKNVSRVDWLERALLEITANMKLDIPIILVIPKMQTETWLLATYTQTELKNAHIEVNNFEEYIDVELALIALGYKESYTKKYKLLKQQSLYNYDEKYAPRIIHKMNLVEASCPQFVEFKNRIMKISH